MESPATMEAASPVEFSAAVKTAATVEALTTVKTAVAVELAALSKVTAEPTAFESSSVEAAAIEAWTLVKPAPVEATSVEPARSVVATEPRSRSDKDAAGKPVRPVVAMRRARIRVIAVVPVRAGRRYPIAVNWRADSNTDYDSLRMGRNRRRKNANAQQSEIS
jgi:hypothetical protein